MPYRCVRKFDAFRLISFRTFCLRIHSIHVERKYLNVHLSVFVGWFYFKGWLPCFFFFLTIFKNCVASQRILISQEGNDVKRKSHFLTILIASSMPKPTIGCSIFFSLTVSSLFLMRRAA